MLNECLKLTRLHIQSRLQGTKVIFVAQSSNIGAQQLYIHVHVGPIGYSPSPLPHIDQARCRGLECVFLFQAGKIYLHALTMNLSLFA